jgi:spoIIIJ-associated protein
MRSIETEGDSIDLAIEKALQTLQVARNQVEVEILADATKGLFGFGGKKARVRATVRPPLVTQLAGGQAREARPAPASRETGTDRVETASRGTETRTTAPENTKPPTAPMPAGHSSEAFLARCKAILEELTNHLGVSCSVAVRLGEDGSVIVEVAGDSGGLLIGRRGQTLDAIEYIVNRIVTRDGEPSLGRIVLDVERYRERRREYLTALAQRLAGKVRQTGRVVTLNPMSPRDRRIVHMALQDEGEVATRSQGDGHFRKVLIVPADRSRKGSRQPRPVD